MVDEIEKRPLPSGKPTSGTYGERKELDDLKGALPPMGPGGESGPAAGPSPMPGANPQMPQQPGGRPLNAPPGVPTALLNKTDQPEVPLNSPLGGLAEPVPQAQSGQEARLALLQALAESDTVSEETRSWAQAVLDMLTNA